MPQCESHERVSRFCASVGSSRNCIAWLPPATVSSDSSLWYTVLVQITMPKHLFRRSSGLCGVVVKAGKLMTKIPTSSFSKCRALALVTFFVGLGPFGLPRVLRCAWTSCLLLFRASSGSDDAASMLASSAGLFWPERAVFSWKLLDGLPEVIGVDNVCLLDTVTKAALLQTVRASS